MARLLSFYHAMLKMAKSMFFEIYFKFLKKLILSFLAHIFSVSMPSLSFLSGKRNWIAISSNPPPTKFVQFFEIKNKSFPKYIINCTKKLLRDLRPLQSFHENNPTNGNISTTISWATLESRKVLSKNPGY